MTRAEMLYKLANWVKEHRRLPKTIDVTTNGGLFPRRHMVREWGGVRPMLNDLAVFLLEKGGP